MTTTFDEKVRASDLKVHDEERDAGVVALKAITFKRTTIVLAQDADGVTAVGTNVSWPGTRHIAKIGLEQARHHAIDRLFELRSRRRLPVTGGVPA